MAKAGSRNRIAKEPARQTEPGHESGFDMHAVGEAVAHHPASSALVAFGLGFGVGVALGSLLGESSRSRWEQMGPAEKLGHQLMDAMSHVLPESLLRSS